MTQENKVALITGASRGIGREIALELAKNGYDIVVNYAGNEKAAKEVVELIEKQNQKAILIKADVSSASDVEELFEKTLTHFGRIDVLVNNAGITKDNLMIRMKESDWDDVIDTNLKSVFLCSKLAAKIMMKQREGKIINVSSVVGRIGNAGQVNYVAAKSGVIGMTKTMAKEFATRNITVNAVAPGFIVTDMTDELDEKTKEELLKNIPLKKLGAVSDIAKTVSFLVSDGASYITGQTISVDGGMYM